MSDVRVRLKTGRVRLEYRGSRELFERGIEPLLLGLARGRPARRRAPEAAPAPAPKETEPKGYRPPSDRFGTFQRQLDPEKNGTTNRVAAFAFFLWNYEKKEVFREDEVEGCFRAEGISPPEDPADVYGDLLSRRLLSPGAADRTWRLTGKGRDFVRHHLLSA